MSGKFTLIELLVVMTLLVLVTGVVVPAGVRLLESFDHRLARTEARNQEKRAEFRAFIRDAADGGDTATTAAPAR